MLQRFAHRAVWNRDASRIEIHLVSLTRQRVRIPGAQLDLTLHVRERADGLYCSFEYSTDLFDGPGRDRVVAVDLAEQGADFCEVYRYFLERGISEHDSYRVTQRVFRGGTLTGGSVFTKDISYVKGFVENVNFIRSAIQSGVPEIIPMLFVGKVTLDDLPLLYERYLECVIAGPKYLPSMFKDLNGLYVWFGFSSGSNKWKALPRPKSFPAIPPPASGLRT